MNEADTKAELIDPKTNDKRTRVAAAQATIFTLLNDKT